MGAYGYGRLRHRGSSTWFAAALTGALVGYAALAGAGTTAHAGTTTNDSLHATRHDGSVPSSSEHIVWSHFVDLDFTAARIMVSDPTGQHPRPLTHPAAGVVDINPRVSPN